ncbi:MAG: hypothetical protein JSV17_07890 [Candidatus Aminicenantes bacterium]|nr:MAG: hypothetical protein JSV17_07890 [Candidatus Aminicenantes bacterium]
MKTNKYLSIIGMTIICVMAFSSDLPPLSELYKTGKVWFEQEFVLDDDTMPKDIFFESPSTVTCDPKGNIYVVDSGALNIKKFDAQGKFLKTIGREGQGPGEFGGVYYSTFAKDRLIVWDSGNRRLNSFTPEGMFVNSTNIAYETGSVRKLRGFPTGEVLVEMEKSYRREPDKPQICTIDLYSPDLKHLRTIYKRELWRKKYIRTKEYGITTLYFPYSADVQWDVTPNGRIVIGFSESYELEIYDRTGEKISSISHTFEPVEVSERDKKNYFDSLEFYRMGERLKEVPEYITKYTEFPKHKPVYENILVDSEGNFWVVLNRGQKRGNGIIFDAFDPEGNLISRVQIEGDILFPSNRHAYLIHDKSLLILKTGDDDLYSLIKGRISN